MENITDVNQEILKIGIIYKITSPSGKSYVGQTHQPLHERMRQHQYKNSNCIKLKRAIKKYGWNQLNVSVLWKDVVWKGTIHDFTFNKEEIENDINDILGPKEKHFIALYDSFKNGYNCTTGGEKGKVYSLELRKKISDGMKKAHAEGRAYPGGAQTGRKLSASHKRKISVTVSRYIQNNRKKSKCYKNRWYKRRGEVFLSARNHSNDWVHLLWYARGPYPKRKFLGTHGTKKEANAALKKYKQEHPEEFD